APLPAMHLRGEVVGALDYLDVAAGVVAAHPLDQLAQGHRRSRGKPSSGLGDDGLGHARRRTVVRAHDDIIEGWVVIIDPVELAVAAAVGGLPGLDLAQPLLGRPALP